MNFNSVTSTSLDDPLYYLRNAQQIIQLCLEHYSDLLLQDEIHSLQQLLSLDEPTQALLIRMVMRKGLLFRKDKLHYSEVPNLDEAISTLTETGYLDDQPSISISSLCDLSRREECLILLKHLLPDLFLSGPTRKIDIVDTLISTFGNDLPKRIDEWWADCPFTIIELRCDALFDRLRLMFFGNLYQSWSEFVLTELGLQRFERVPLTPESRPFQSRSEVDLYLSLNELQQRASEGEGIDLLSQYIPPPVECSWIDYRRRKVIFQLGREAERHQQTELALQLFQQSQYQEAQLRALRILEKTAPAQQVFALA
ncbi:MAG: VRR-NUC domain-containing protein, partial [Oceanospirillales bacterium]